MFPQPIQQPDQFLTLSGIVLVACLTRGPGFVDQLSLIRRAAWRWGTHVRTVILVGESPESFPAQLELTGTPSYVLFENGREYARRLGQVDLPDLDRLVGLLRKRWTVCAPEC